MSNRFGVGRADRAGRLEFANDLRLIWGVRDREVPDMKLVDAMAATSLIVQRFNEAVAAVAGARLGGAL